MGSAATRRLHTQHQLDIWSLLHPGGCLPGPPLCCAFDQGVPARSDPAAGPRRPAELPRRGPTSPATVHIEKLACNAPRRRMHPSNTFTPIYLFLAG
jgi:hypothetical protein